MHRLQAMIPRELPGSFAKSAETGLCEGRQGGKNTADDCVTRRRANCSPRLALSPGGAGTRFRHSDRCCDRGVATDVSTRSSSELAATARSNINRRRSTYRRHQLHQSSDRMNGIANRERPAGLLLKKSRNPTQKQLKLRRVDRSVHCNCHWSAYQHQILHDNTLARASSRPSSQSARHFLRTVYLRT